MTAEHFVAAPADMTKVNICLRSDMRYWTRILGVNDVTLRKAVMTVGESSWNVRAEIRRMRRS